MQSEMQTVPASKTALWAGRILTALAVLFLLFDGVAKVMRAAPVLEACAQLQIPERVIPGLGAVLIVATLIYAFPPTSVLGAIVLTGYLGGATWTHVRMGGPVFPIVFPSLVGALIWGGLYLREPRLRALIQVRRPRPSGGQLPRPEVAHSAVTPSRVRIEPDVISPKVNRSPEHPEISPFQPLREPPDPPVGIEI
jgi:hypothetical protein